MFLSFLAASTKLQFAFKVRFYGESFSKIELIAGFVGATLQKETCQLEYRKRNYYNYNL